MCSLGDHENPCERESTLNGQNFLFKVQIFIFKSWSIERYSKNENVTIASPERISVRLVGNNMTAQPCIRDCCSIPCGAVMWRKN